MITIRKIIVLLLVISMLGSGFSPVLAKDYHGQVLEYLADKLQVQEEEIHLEGSLIELEFTGEQLWAGRYYLKEINGEDTGDEDSGRDGDPVDTPDEAVDSGREISGNLAGGVVYLHLKTGDILTAEQAELLFAEEWKLQQQELDRLVKDAGKIDPYLYRQLINSSPDEVFEVIIWLKYRETEAMREAMEAVYDEYPEFPAGGARTAPAEPGLYDNGGAGSDGVTGRMPLPAGQVEPGYAGDDGMADDEYGIMPYPDKEIQPGSGEEPEILPEDRELPPDRVDYDEMDWARYEEMMEKLAEIRMQGYRDSFEQLTSELDSIGINYEALEGGALLLCEMTAGQLLSFKDADYIEAISEDMVVTLDAAERAFASIAMDDSAIAEKPGNPVPWIAAAAALLVGGAVCFTIVSRRRKALSDEGS